MLRVYVDFLQKRSLAAILMACFEVLPCHLEEAENDKKDNAAIEDVSGSQKG